MLLSPGAGPEPALFLSTVGNCCTGAAFGQLGLQQPVHELRDSGSLVQRMPANGIAQPLRHAHIKTDFIGIPVHWTFLSVGDLLAPLRAIDLSIVPDAEDGFAS